MPFAGEPQEAQEAVEVMGLACVSFRPEEVKWLALMAGRMDHVWRPKIDLTLDLLA